MNPSVQLTPGILIVNPYPLDFKYFNSVTQTPYTDVAEVLTQVTSGYRHQGLTVNIAGVEYWFKEGVADANLVLKIPGDLITESQYTEYSTIVKQESTAAPEVLTISPNSVVGKLDGATTDITAVSILSDISGTLTTNDSLVYAKTIKDYVDAIATGALIYKEGYDATTNIPPLDGRDSSTILADIKAGWTYTITAADHFFDVLVEVGDMIIAEKNDPIVIGDWTIVSKQLDLATETVFGLSRLATEEEAILGLTTAENGVPAVITPEVLQKVLKLGTGIVNARIFTTTISSLNETAPQGTDDYYTLITHNLNSRALITTVRGVTDNRVYEVDIEYNTADTLKIYLPHTLAPDSYVVTVIG